MSKTFAQREKTGREDGKSGRSIQGKNITRHNPPALFDPAPYGFSHVVTVPAGSRLIYVAGQGAKKIPPGN